MIALKEENEHVDANEAQVQEQAKEQMKKHVQKVASLVKKSQSRTAIIYYLESFRNCSSMLPLQNEEFKRIVSFLEEHGMLAKSKSSSSPLPSSSSPPPQSNRKNNKKHKPKEEKKSVESIHITHLGIELLKVLRS